MCLLAIAIAKLAGATLQFIDQFLNFRAHLGICDARGEFAHTLGFGAKIGCGCHRVPRGRELLGLSSASFAGSSAHCRQRVAAYIRTA